MFSRIVAALAATAGIAAFTIPPASAASSTSSVTVAVTASTQATIGATSSSGTNIACAVGTAISGIVPCATTVTLAGTFRSTKSTGGATVSLTGATITGSGGAAIAPNALTMTCTGGLTGSPTYAGTAGTLASATALSTSATTCMSWTGTVVSAYSLNVALGIDAALVPADTYTNGSFTATATAN